MDRETAMLRSLTEQFDVSNPQTVTHSALSAWSHVFRFIR